VNPLHRERVVTTRGDVLTPEARGDEAVPPPESSRRPATYTEHGGPTGEPWLDSGPSMLTPDEARALTERWRALQGSFIESPRAAVEQADELLGAMIQRVLQGMSEERASLREALQDAALSTEELRLALRRYRALFDRLLAFY
jgi:hypothetical protein